MKLTQRSYRSLPQSICLSLVAFVFPLVGQFMIASIALGQVMSHGPVVGGVTNSRAKVFVRTDQAASVVLRYSTNPNLNNYLVSDTVTTASEGDFTSIIQLADLSAETTYY